MKYVKFQEIRKKFKNKVRIWMKLLEAVNLTSNTKMFLEKEFQPD